MRSIESTTDTQTGKIEILLFSLGSSEIFGLNVFKIREVTEMMPVTKMPGATGALMGMVSLRGNVLPVIDLGMATGMSGSGPEPSKLIIAEFASRSLAFAVSEVDKIVRVDWSAVKPPQTYDAGQSCIFGVILLDESRLVSLLDIEGICQQVLPIEESEPVPNLELHDRAPVFFVDDSLVARKQITHVLDAMGLKHLHAVNGNEAQQKLMHLVQGSETQDIRNKVSLVLVDEEMPGMDGCALARTLKSDSRFKNIPVVMYSSLTSDENERRGLNAGVDLYVKKFDAEKLSMAIAQLLDAVPA